MTPSAYESLFTVDNLNRVKESLNVNFEIIDLGNGMYKQTLNGVTVFGSKSFFDKVEERMKDYLKSGKYKNSFEKNMEDVIK